MKNIKRLNNEKGFTLLLSIFIGLLFSIILVSIVTLTSSGIDRNESRENEQQATELAEKGTTHIVSYINTRLSHAIGNDGMIQDDFINLLQSELNDLLCVNHNGFEIETVTGDKYQVCVLEHHPTVDEIDGELREIPTRREVQFRSTGYVDGEERIVTSTIVVGAQAVPDALNYSIGVHCLEDSCDDFDGEGNLFLHGGVHVEGDLKVDGNVITSNQGIARQGNTNYWVRTAQPDISPGPNSRGEHARMFLGKGIYTFNHPQDYDRHIRRTSFNSGYTNATNQLDAAFRVAPQIVREERVRDVVNVNETINASTDWLNDVDNQRVEGTTFNNTRNNYEDTKVIGYTIGQERGECIRWIYWWCSEYEYYETETQDDIILRGNNTFKRFATTNRNDVVIRYNDTAVEIKEIMYIDGDLTIGNGTNSYNPNDYDRLQLKGREIYVNGDLEIKGANIDFDVIMYVRGEVNIQNSVINGIELGGENEYGSLIVFADKQIHISNNSVHQPDPSNIRGYFYSNDRFEMYGVGSNIRIVGGISARQIVLNAIRGTAEKPRWNNSCSRGTYIVGSCLSPVENGPSRLTVIYNDGIVGRFSDLQLTEPIIYNLESPNLVDRE